MNVSEIFFKASSIIVGDGSLGTFMEDQGLSGLPEIHNIKNPKKIQEIHELYLHSGSMIITTNSFNGNLIRLKQHGLKENLVLLNSRAVDLAKKAIKTLKVNALIAGGVGPTGQILKPYGEMSSKDALDSYFAQVKILFEGGVDFFLIETMSDLEEVKIAIEAIRKICDLPIAVTMNFSQNLHTIMGVSSQKALEELYLLGIRMVGANCGNGLQEAKKIMESMSLTKRKDVILISQPNMGIPTLNEKGETKFEIREEELADYVRIMKELGVRYLGGCCGSTPNEISLIKKTLNI